MGSWQFTMHPQIDFAAATCTILEVELKYLAMKVNTGYFNVDSGSRKQEAGSGKGNDVSIIMCYIHVNRKLAN